MPDYNPDREGHVKHEYLIINAEKKQDSVSVDGKQHKFNEDGYFKIPDDPGLANAIRQQVGRSATVTRVRKPDAVADRGHRYHFGQMPEMPWKRKKESNGEEKEQETNHAQEETQQVTEGQIPELDSGTDRIILEVQNATQEGQIPQGNLSEHSD